MATRTLLERIIEERVGQTLVGSVSTAADRIAEDIAKEALADESFRRAIREIVHHRSEEILDEMLRRGNGQSPRARRPRRHR